MGADASASAFNRALTTHKSSFCLSDSSDMVDVHYEVSSGDKSRRTASLNTKVDVGEYNRMHVFAHQVCRATRPSEIEADTTWTGYC